MDPVIDTKFINLYQTVISVLNGQSLNLINISTVLINLMEEVEKIKTLSGDEKKSLVLSVIQYTINESSLHDNEKIILNQVCNLLIPEIINIIITSSKNGYNLNTIKTDCFSCFSVLKCCK